MILHLDFETRSACDLKAKGLHNYARHSTTDVWCAAYAFDDEEVKIWVPGEEVPSRLKKHIENYLPVGAHNAQFEIAICKNVLVPKYGWPEIKTAQILDTMVMAYAMAIPASLAACAPALGIETVKDLAGSRIMMSMSQPRRMENGEPVWWDDYGRYERLLSYCIQDVKVEREIFKRLAKLSPKETKLWLLDQKINNTGIKIDVESAEKAIAIVEAEKKILDERMRELTDNGVSTCQASARLTEWVNEQGIPTEGVAKPDIADILIRPNVPAYVKEVLKLRKEAAKSSTAKFKAMIEGSDEDGRAKGLFQFHGASTGRWAGRRIQLQNLPRVTISDEAFDGVFSILESTNLKNTHVARDKIDLFYGSPISTLSNCIRGFIVAEEGYELIGADFNSIEARVLGWLANEKKVLDVFRGDGLIYEHAASAIFGKEVGRITPNERQIGKVATLALGYGGGKGAFTKMATGYGVHIEASEAEEIKSAWRAAHSNIVGFWYNLESSAISAMDNPGKKIACGKIAYLRKGSFLWCKLPSERVLCYPFPKVSEEPTPWGDLKRTLSYKAENSISKKWEYQSVYGGLLAENVTQAVARDLLAEAMLRIDNMDTGGWPIVLHVHDEVVCEVPEGSVTLEKFEKVVAENPDWAEGLPIKAKAFKSRRYSK